VFGLLPPRSTKGGLIIKTHLAVMVNEQVAAPVGLQDSTVHIHFGPQLQSVQGQGYGRWFWAMAFLHPLAWLMLRAGGIARHAAR
jgi:ACS family hexuronate transporter-like MFS transporter